MSMYPDPENFDQLRRLLALKRHEEPPPGYFHHFSGQVIARICAGEHADTAWGLLWDAPWPQRLWAALEARPVLAGSVGVACCALLLTSVVLFDGNTDTNSAQSVAPQAFEASLGFTDHSSRGSFFEMLREQKDWLDLYPLNPLTPTRYRQTFLFQRRQG